MPPQVSRYPPQNLSNPFAHLNQQNLHQASNLQHPNAHLQGHNLGHPGFAGGIPNGSSIFGPQSGASGLQAGFGAAGGLGGGTGLASHAAQLGFQHGAALQQQAHEAAMMGANQSKGQAGRIREVWKSNLAEEMATLRSLIDRYPYVSMDTEFPGVVARPIGEFSTKASYHYQTLRCNVDLLKIIQLGITLFSIEGEAVPPTELAGAKFTGMMNNTIKVCPCTWTFNFKFSPEEDMYNEESLNLLKKAGADFEKHLNMGIDPDDFGSLLISSGMVMSDDVHWVSFHSGYDFAYLVKLMKPEPLPENEDEYRELVKIFFVNLYDVKYMLRWAQKQLQRGILSPAPSAILNNLGQKSGLQDLAEELGSQRIGVQHQAGSDAWLTGSVFWQMKEKVLGGHVPEELNGEMWGLTGVGPPASTAVQTAVLSQGHVPNGLMGGHGFHTSMTPTTHRDPATPTSNPAGLAQTPGQGYGSSLTPGAGGVFGNFQQENVNVWNNPTPQWPTPDEATYSSSPGVVPYPHTPQHPLRETFSSPAYNNHYSTLPRHRRRRSYVYAHPRNHNALNPGAPNFDPPTAPKSPHEIERPSGRNGLRHHFPYTSAPTVSPFTSRLRRSRSFTAGDSPFPNGEQHTLDPESPTPGPNRSATRRDGPPEEESLLQFSELPAFNIRKRHQKRIYQF